MSIKRLMFIAVSRRRSPSTVRRAMKARSAATSGSVRSLVRVSGATPATSQALRAVVRPTPKTWVNPITMCLFIGMLMPAMRAMCCPGKSRGKSQIVYLENRNPSIHAQPWRCLWRASVQMMNTTPRRRTTLQFLQIFLTDGRTFMTCDPGVGRRAGSALGARAAGAAQVGLADQAFVLVRHHVRVQLRDEV